MTRISPSFLGATPHPQSFYATKNKMKEPDNHNQEVEEKITNNVLDYGWHVVKVEATEYLPSFAYTIGLWKKYKHPELIAFGLTTETLHSILNIGGDIAKSGSRLFPNCENDELFENSKAYILEVNPNNLSDYFGYGIWFNESEFPALQIVWTDRNQNFPWEENFEEEFIYRQPLLDRNSKFKFREERNLGVITNKHFIEEGSPILYVEHDEEGDWIFLTGDEWLTSDAKLVSLEEMIKRDNSLNELFNLDYGEIAQRSSLLANWKRGTSKEK